MSTSSHDIGRCPQTSAAQTKRKPKHRHAHKCGRLIGEVQHIKAAEKPSGDDEITIKSGESRLIVERGRVAKIFAANGTTTSADKVA